MTMKDATVNVDYMGYKYPGQVLNKYSAVSEVRLFLPGPGYKFSDITVINAAVTPRFPEKTVEEHLYPIGSEVFVSNTSGRPYKGVVKVYDAILKRYSVEVDLGNGKIQKFDCSENMIQAVPRDEHEVKDDRPKAKFFMAKFKRDQVVEIVKRSPKWDGQRGMIIDKPIFDPKHDEYWYRVLVSRSGAHEKKSKKFYESNLIAVAPLTPKQWIQEPNQRKFNIGDTVNWKRPSGVTQTVTVTGWHFDSTKKEFTYSIQLPFSPNSTQLGVSGIGTVYGKDLTLVEKSKDKVIDDKFEASMKKTNDLLRSKAGFLTGDKVEIKIAGYKPRIAEIARRDSGYINGTGRYWIVKGSDGAEKGVAEKFMTLVDPGTELTNSHLVEEEKPRVEPEKDILDQIIDEAKIIFNDAFKTTKLAEEPNFAAFISRIGQVSEIGKYFAAMAPKSDKKKTDG